MKELRPRCTSAWQSAHLGRKLYSLTSEAASVGFLLQVRQGELSDPLYFDFISFAQYATVCQEFTRGRQVFKVQDLRRSLHTHMHCALRISSTHTTGSLLTTTSARVLLSHEHILMPSSRF